jgi:hypothetical protein
MKHPDFGRIPEVLTKASRNAQQKVLCILSALALKFVPSGPTCFMMPDWLPLPQPLFNDDETDSESSLLKSFKLFTLTLDDYHHLFVEPGQYRHFLCHHDFYPVAPIPLLPP